MNSLQERSKEQACMYAISELDEQESSIENLLKEAIKIIPEGWINPNLIAVKIDYDDKSFCSPDFRDSDWLLSTETEVKNNHYLTVEIVFLGWYSDQNESPFTDEKYRLLDFIANQLSCKLNIILSRQELIEEHDLLEKAYHLAHIGTWEFDMKTHRLLWAPITKEVHGFERDYEPDLESTIELFQEGEHRDTFRKAAMNAVEHEIPFDVELKIISGKGDERWIRATGEPEYKDGVCTRFYGISQDVTARRQAEENLQFSEQRFKTLVQDGSDMIAILDAEANYIYASSTSKSILGIPSESLIGTNAFDYIHEEDKERIHDLLSGMTKNQRVTIPAFRFKNADGKWRWIETTITNMIDDPAIKGLVTNSRDVTEQMIQKQNNLEALKEKEILLTEIHHRVKNNLAVVSGMIQLQIMDEDNPVIRDRLLDSISRIKTMANIHEQLYKSKSFSKLNFAENIRTLVMDIKETFQVNTKVTIHFNSDCIQMNINQAIPCSQIVNEVVTNVFKHAFPGIAEGDIWIDLVELQDKDKNICLSIQDNGIGLPKDINDNDINSLGLNIINVLSHQLNAKYSYESTDPGTTFTIQFKKDEIKGIGNVFLK